MVKSSYKPIITVGVCSHGRAAYLLNCLKSLSAQSLESSQFEVIVIASGYEDDIQAEIDNFNSINIKFIQAPLASLSNSRNLAIKESKAPYIAFIDDDAEASEQWLERIVDNFSESSTNVACIGGESRPILETAIPQWLDKKLQCYLSVYNLGKRNRYLRYNEYLAGVNMAFRKSIFQHTGYFPLALGREGKSLQSGEDIYIQKKIKELGYEILYVPSAMVNHTIPADRLNKNWFIQRLQSDGLSSFHLDLLLSEKNRNISKFCKIGSTAIIRSCKGMLYSLLDRLPINREATPFRYKCFAMQHFAYSRGFKKHYFPYSKNPKKNNLNKSRRIHRLKKGFYIGYSLLKLPEDFLLWQMLKNRKPKVPNSPIRKVLHISPDYFDESSIVGGGERYLEQLAQALHNLVRVEVLSFGKKRLSFERKGVPYNIFPVWRKRPGPLWMPLSIAWVKEIKEADIIHIHQYNDPISQLTLKVAAYFQKPIFISDHGSYPNASHLLPFHRLVTSALLVSNASASVLPAFPRIQIIGGGPPSSFMDNEKAKEIKSDSPYVLFVGRILPDKGVDYLIDAMPNDLPLVIIGKPYDLDFLKECQQMAKDKKVTFLHEMADTDLPKYYKGALVTVLPSVYQCSNGKWNPMPDLMGLVILESYSQSTPVIGTNVGGIPEFIEDGKSGFLVPPNHSSALREKIDALWKNKDKAIQMGSRGRQLIKEKYNFSSIAEICFQEYQRER